MDFQVNTHIIDGKGCKLRLRFPSKEPMNIVVKETTSTNELYLYIKSLCPEFEDIDILTTNPRESLLKNVGISLFGCGM